WGWLTIVAVIIAATVSLGLYFLLFPNFNSTLNFPNEPMTRVPSLIGRPASQVVPALHRAKLHLGREEFTPSPGPAGLIIDQYPGAGVRLNVGGLVSIVVAQRHK